MFKISKICPMAIVLFFVLFPTFATALSCNLKASGPVVASQSGQVIENLEITSDGTPAVTVNGKNKVVLRNLVIHHRGTHGIKIENSDSVLIENVLVENVGAPASGPHSHSNQNNINVTFSDGITINHVKLSRGSSGVYLVESPDSKLSFVEGYDFRGPFPRGQVVQWDKSPNSQLEDFYTLNPNSTAWTEDNVNVYKSSNVTIRRGLIDGNNSPSGIGVIFDGGITSTGLVEDVDAIHMGNGCFSNWDGGLGNVFRRTNCRDIICTAQPRRAAPMSGGLMYAGTSGASDYPQLRIEDSKYWNGCPAGTVWPTDDFAVRDLTKVDFTLRKIIQADVCGVSISSSSVANSSSSSAMPPRTGRIEAESFDGHSGVLNKGTVIGSLDQGDWALWSQVDFRNARFLSIRLAVPASFAGQWLDFHLDSLKGEQLVQVQVPETGDWSIFQTHEFALANTINGLRDVYMIPIPDATHSGGVADVDWLEFLESSNPVRIWNTEKTMFRNAGQVPKRLYNLQGQWVY